MTKSTNDPKLSRRAALTGLGALGATAAVAGCERGWTPPERDPFGRARAKPYVPGAEAWATNEERWATSSCGQCPAACGIRVRVVEGRAVRIEGNEANPLNRGGIGPRGLSGLQVLYDPDRITGPMIRKGGQLAPVSWDEAIGAVATALTKLRGAGQPHRLLVMSGRERGMMNDLLARFVASFGSPNFVDGRPSRTTVIAQAMEEVAGSFELPAYDWAGANYVLALEAGLLEDSCQAVYFARVAAERRRGRAGHRSRLTHVGPQFGLSAYNADRWIRVEPGTSGALALGICRELLVNASYDRVAVTAQVSGFDAFVSEVQAFTPERVSDITGAHPDVVAQLARELWDNRPSFAFVDHRSVAFSNGLDNARAALALNALLGSIEAPEGGVRVAPRPPTRAWPVPKIDDAAKAGAAVARMDRAGTEAFPRARSVYETLVPAIEAEPPQVALLYYSNPLHARHQPDRWKAAMAEIPLVVSFSPFRDETVDELAHVVLPDHTYLERYEDATPAPGLPRAVLGVRQPVVAPLHDTRATGDVVIDLARRVGGTVAESFPWSSFREAMDERLLGLHDAGRGSIRTSTERGFLGELYSAGVWSDSAPPASRSLRVSISAQWKQPTWAGDPKQYPLLLVVYRDLGNAVGGGANQPWLHQLRSRPDSVPWEHPVRAHPSTVPGVSDGDTVTVASEWGQVVVPIRLERRMVPGIVAIAAGRGHTAYGRFARGVGVNAMSLLAPGAAPVTGASVMCGTRVKITGGARG